MKSAIPSVNLSHYTNGSRNEQLTFIDAVGSAFSEIGFVALRGHFLDDTLTNHLYTSVKDFFALPESTRFNMKLKEWRVSEDTLLSDEKLLKEVRSLI
jgi:isopenicillin N synthase-like dioxygenase